jgi:hypothetical protein
LIQEVARLALRMEIPQVARQRFAGMSYCLDDDNDDAIVFGSFSVGCSGRYAATEIRRGRVRS